MRAPCVMIGLTADGSAVCAVPMPTAVRPIEAARPEKDGLVERAASGDRTAQRALFSELRPRVVRHVAYLLRRRAEVDDVVQEVFLEIFRSLPSFQGRSTFSTWIHRITVRATYRHLRRRWADAVLPEPFDGSAPEATDPAHGAEVRDRHDRLMRLLDRLAPKKRMVLALHDLQGLDTAQIAKLVGAPVLTVRTRLFYARRELYAAAREDPVLAEFFQEEPG